MYSIPLGGARVRQPFAIGGSGSTYIYGYCDANFRPGMTREEALNFCRNGLCLFMCFMKISSFFEISSFPQLCPWQCHVMGHQVVSFAQP